MTHEHLALDLLHRLEGDGDGDQHGAGRERQVNAAPEGDHRRDSRQQRKEDTFEEDQAMRGAGEVIDGGLALTDAGDRAAVLLHVLE